MKQTANSLTSEDILTFAEQYRNNPVRRATAHAIARGGLNASAFQNQALRDIRHVFSLEIKTMPVTNQKASGRCWLFAGLNVLREQVARQYKLDEFELSQNYLAFWDKFEKINYFLETVLETLDEPADGRLISWLMTSFQDGGQWDMFVNLVRKYGVVPRQAMPETFHSEATGACNALLGTRLRRCAAELRRLFRSGTPPAGLADRKREMVGDLYGVLCQFFGEPPSCFDWEYTDKDSQYACFRNLTPLDFTGRFIALNLDDYISIIHAPTRDKPFGRTFTVRYINNVVGGKNILYLNLDMPAFKGLVLQQLQAGEVVWFGSDVGHDGDRETGAWFSNLYDYAGILDLELDMTKEDMLDYRQSAMNHAMVLTGTNLLDGQPNRWKIENSWGDERGKKGYFVADDGWFDRYVYQAVIRRSLLSDEQRQALTQKPIVLEPWDPMGTLAD